MTVLPEVASLVQWGARSVLIVLLAWCAAACFSRARFPAALRHATWLLAIGAVALLPLLSVMLPALPVPIDRWIAPSGAAPPGAGAGEAAPIGAWISVLYVTGCAGCFLRLLVGRHALARGWREAQCAPGIEWERLAAEARAATGVSRPLEIRISDTCFGPMTWGAARPKILLPTEARLWGIERRRLVLLHELAHVARHDALIQLAASVVCALHWFNPAVWFAAAQLRAEQEHACDERVLAAGVEAHSYARELLDIAARMPRTAGFAQIPSILGARSQLERRLRSLVRSAARPMPGPLIRACFGVLALVTAGAIAAASPASALYAAPPQNRDTGQVQLDPDANGQPTLPSRMRVLARAPNAESLSLPAAPIAPTPPRPVIEPTPPISPVAPNPPIAPDANRRPRS